MEKKKYLSWVDILILTALLFGHGIYSSTLSFLAVNQGQVAQSQALTFTSAINYQALSNQLFWLGLALLYLKVRRFDFRQISYRVIFDWKVVYKAILIFLVSALVIDIYYYLTYYGSYYLTQPASPSLAQILGNIDISLILYSLLNGFYEEFFFLGLLYATRPKYHYHYLIFGTLVRISFHTYQGITMALGIGIVYGLTLYLLYRWFKPKNLVPFFLGHALADILGLSVMAFFF